MAFEALSGEISLDKRDYTRGLRDAAKQTMSFGKTATGTFDDVGDEADEAGRSVLGAVPGFSRLEEAAGDAVVPMRRLAGASDEAEDELGTVSRKALTTASAFSALTVSTNGLSMSMGLVSGGALTMTAALVGLVGVVGVLATAMLPVVVGAGAMAAAFGAIIGTGIIAWGDGFSSALADARKQIMPLVKEFGSQFIPFLKETIGLLPDLVANMLAAVGPIGPFVDALRTLRDTAFDLLPKFISWWADLGRWALPILADFGNWIVTKFVPAFISLIDTGKSLFGTLSSLGPQVNTVKGAFRALWGWVTGLADAYRSSAQSGTPLVQKLGELSSSARRFWTQLQPLIDALIPLSQEFVKILPTISKFSIDILKLAMAIGGKLVPPLVSLTKVLTGVFQWFNNLSPAIKKIIIAGGALLASIGPIIGVVSSIISGFLTFVGIVSTIGSAVATIIAVMNPIGLAIAGIVAALAGLYAAWQTNFLGIRDITNSVISGIGGILNKAKSNFAQSFRALALTATAAYNAIMPDQLGIPRVSLPRVEFSVPGLTIEGHTVYEGRTVGVGPFGPFGGQSIGIPQLDTGGFIESGGMAMLHEGEQVVPAAQVDRGGGGGGAQSVNVHVTLDTQDEALQQWVDERAETKIRTEVEQTRRRQKRREGR